LGKYNEIMSYRKTAHSVYDLKYHIVWITKYRKPILRGEIGKRIRELIRQTCASLDVYIVKGHVSKDHVHLLLSVPPSLAVSELVKRLKGRSSRLLLEEPKQSLAVGRVWRVAKGVLGQASVGARILCSEQWKCDG